MSDVQGPPGICGFTLTTGLLCHHHPQAREQYCPWHEQHASCQGCGARAHRECPAFVGTSRCGHPLCSDCSHSDAGHGRVLTPAEQTRRGLATAVQISLKGLSDRGLITVTEAAAPTVAEQIVDDLGMHLVLQVLSGMTNPAQ